MWMCTGTAEREEEKDGGRKENRWEGLGEGEGE